MTGTELRRWYWLKDELVAFARLLGVRATGSKEELAARLCAHLDGGTPDEARASRHSSAPPARRQLQPPLSQESFIPSGQRCSQVVRDWFREQVGPTFRFDAAMRDFFARADGTQRLADALEHWHRTRGVGPKGIGEQFEFNRFTRAWHMDHPQGSRPELLRAWQQYRNTPVDER